MKILPILLLLVPVSLFGQGHVGVGTITPAHPFQVNVDSVWTDTIEDYFETPNIGFSAGLAITPGSQKGAQRFPIGQTGYLSSIKFYFAFPTNATQVLIEVFSGPGPEGVLMTSGLMNNVTIGAATLHFAQPWSWVEEGDTLNVVMSPLSGASCKWKWGMYGPPDIPPHLAFHYTGSWDTIDYSLALATYITFNDTVVHQVLKVKEDRTVGINDYYFPRYDGNNGDIIKTSGNGNLTWSSPSTLSVNAVRDADNDTKVEVEASPDEDIIRMRTAGSERMTLLANGNIGIGTISPGNRLRINGSTTSSQHVLSVGVNFSGENQIRAIESFSTPANGFGVAGYFVGGARGIQSFAEGYESTGLSIAVEGSAYGTAGTRTGVFGRAIGGTTNWAGYFAEGNVRVLNEMYIDGDVGIGTTNPGNKLRVNGSTSSSQHVFSAGTNYSGNVNIRAVEGFSTPAVGYGIGGYFVGGNKGIQAIGNGGASASTVTAVEGVASGSAGTRTGIFGMATGGVTNWAGHFGSGNVWVENDLQTDGSVQIGTSGTPHKLKVHGSPTATAAVVSVTTGYDGLSEMMGVYSYIKPSVGVGTGGLFSGGRKGLSAIANSESSPFGCTAMDAQATGTSSVKIAVRGEATGGGTNWAGFFPAGNVFIADDLRLGTSASGGVPGYKLAVDGKIIAEEVRIQLSEDWPDYVFQPDYPLLPLDQLKLEIAALGRLPGMPTAHQVASEGILLGDMQRQMMEKIEELTLHMIQLHERINFLEKENLALRQQAGNE